MSSFEILCVTMHQKDFSKLEEMNIHSNVVFANQADDTAYEEYEFDGCTAKMISTNTRGVGVNRNLSLSYASADICLLADDDVVYKDDMEKLVVSEFETHPDADIMIFHLDTSDPVRRPISYPKTKKCRGLFKMPWGGARIAFRLNSVRKANVWFSTLYGGGCIFPSGEDSKWLYDARRAGLNFYVSNQTIGEVSYEVSSWFTGYDEKYFYGVGACYAGIHPKAAIIKYLYTAIRTMTKESDLTFFQKMKWMRYGRKGYEQLISYQAFQENRNK